MELKISTDRYLRALLRDREGYRDEMYPDGKDDKGRQLYSAGIGHQLSSEEVKRWKGKKIPDEIIEAWFEKDYNNALDDANVLMVKEKIPFSENVFAAMTSASYQLGRTSFSKFKETFRYLREGNIEKATEEAKNSEWFRGNKKENKIGTPKRVHDFNNLLDPTYVHPEKFELKDTTPFTMNLDTDMYVQRDMLGEDSSVDRLGFVNPNIDKEGPNARVRGDVNLGFRSPQGFVNIGMDDKRNVRGEGGIYTPYGTLTGNTEENYSFQGNPFRVGDANVRLSADSMQGPKLNVNRGPLNIEATEDFLRANYKDLSATLTDEEITATYNLNPNVLLSGKYSKDGDFNVGVKGKFRFQEGGEVDKNKFPVQGLIDADLKPTQPSLTSSVLPNETVQPTGFVDNIPSADTVDTTQGFYSVNPAPGESSADFEQRTMQYTQPVDRPTVKTSSFRPPEGYVSPRISNSFEDLFGFSGGDSTLDYSYTGGDSGSGSTSNTNLSSGNAQTFSLFDKALGTFDDILASGNFNLANMDGLNEDAIKTSLDTYTKTYFNAEDFSKENFYKSLWTESVVGIDGVETTKTNYFNKYIWDDTFANNTDIKLNDLLGDKYRDINEYAAANGNEAASILFDQAIQLASIDEIANEIGNINLDTTITLNPSDNATLLRNPDGSLMRDANGVVMLGTQGDDLFLRNADGSIMRDANGVAMINTNKALISGGGSKVNILNPDGNITTMSQINTSSSVDDILTNLESYETGNANSIKLNEAFLDTETKTGFFDKIGSITIGSDSNFNVQVKDLYDEFASAFVVNYITGDGGKALGAAAGQFLKTNVVDYYTDQTFQTASTGFSKTIANATSVAEINTALKNAGYETVIDPNTDLAAAKNTASQAVGGIEATKFNAYATAGGAMAQVLLMGGSEEDALLAGAESIATTLGATPLGEALGFSGVQGSFTDPTAIGGGIISGLAAYIRTGKAEDAVTSAGTSYLMSVNPVVGLLAMSATMLVGNPDPKNYAGYTALNLEDMSVQSYSHGDVDSNKASPENLAFTQKVMEGVTPILKDIKDKYGITSILGDLEIMYGDRDGLYLNISEDKEITGFTNRVSYNEAEGDLNRNQIYSKKFDTIEQLENHLIELFTWSAENMTVDGVLDLTNLVDRRKEKMNQTLLASLGSGYSSVGSLMGDPRGGNYETGGKILDKNKKVLYNSNQAKNYGLVNKKGKAPPSARADDVPMTLKEGDYVLSQPAVALYGEDTINRMVQRAANEAGTNLKSGGKVPVNVHNGEYIIPKKLTEYIGSNVLENMNNRGLMSVGERPNT